MRARSSWFLALAVLFGCATVPPATLHRPSAPLYRGSFGAASCVAGAAGIAPSATLTFTPPTTNLDGSPVDTPLTYNLYQGTSSGSETKVETALAGSPIVLNTGIKGNASYYFELTAVDAKGDESPRSNEVCKTFPVSPPNAIVITIQ